MSSRKRTPLDNSWLSVCLFALATTSVVAQETGDLPDKKSDVKCLIAELPTREQSSPAAKFTVTLTPASAKPGERVTLQIEATIARGWHINALSQPADSASLPTRIHVDSDILEPIEKEFQLSQPPEELVSGGFRQLCHANTVAWTRIYRAKQGDLKSTKGSIEFQACNDQKCLPPLKLKFDFQRSKTRRSQIAENRASDPIGKPISIGLQPCNLERPRAKLSFVGLLMGNQPDQLVLKGSFVHEEKEFDIFLPDAARYKLQNKADGNFQAQNTATHISIDHNDDGIIEAWETHASNIPFRIADAMYQIVKIDKAARLLSLQRVNSPVNGSILGRKVAPFEFVTTDGNKVSDKSILGKVTLLDIWAVT